MTEYFSFYCLECYGDRYLGRNLLYTKKYVLWWKEGMRFLLLFGVCFMMIDSEVSFDEKELSIY